MNRRRALTLMGTVGLVGVAGCTGGENGEFNYAAAPAAVPDASGGYQVEGPNAMEINETVEIGGLSRDVHIETWTASYGQPDDQTGMFLISTPNVEVGGVSVNPLARLSGADLLVRVIDEGIGRAGGDASVNEVEQETELTVPVLGEDRTVPVFSAVLDTGGSGGSGMEGMENGEIPIRLYLLSMTHPREEGEDAPEDALLAVGFHPESVDASAEIQSLMEGIEHPVEGDSDSGQTSGEVGSGLV